MSKQATAVLLQLMFRMRALLSRWAQRVLAITFNLARRRDELSAKALILQCCTTVKWLEAPSIDDGDS